MNTAVPSETGQAAPVTAQVIELGELNPGCETQGAAITTEENLLHQVKTLLQVSVGQVALTVGQLLAAKEHQVLRLDSRVEQPVELLLEGTVVARGQLVAVDGHFAVRITELPVALKV
jgi:flagellar motor switch protein FliN/FliY